MIIAVTSQNFRTITPHAGKTRRFLVFEVAPGGAAVEVDRLDLPPELAFHNHRDPAPHPLDGIDVLIAGSAGDGFIRRAATRGFAVATTSERDPLVAIAAYLRGTLAPSAGHA